jgi:hypothetical protein
MTACEPCPLEKKLSFKAMLVERLFYTKSWME